VSPSLKSIEFTFPNATFIEVLMSAGGSFKFKSVPLVGGIVVAAALTIAASWALKQPVDERPLRSRLAEMGIIATLDSNGCSIGSVNLTTIKDRTQLPEALGLILQLENVSSLGLDALPISNADLEQIGELSSLATLSLSDCDVGGAGYQSLKNLDNLQYLHLPGTNTNDEDLECLAELTSLVSVDLSRTKVRSNLHPLARLPRLKWLLLSQDELGEGALSGLIAAPVLSRLTLFDATFSASDLQLLQSAKPDMTVDNK
jgi:hypothetical protein